MTGNARYALILAAGKGTRFKSDQAKVLHSLCGRPLITYLLDKLSGLGIEKTFVVVGPGASEIQETLHDYDLLYIRQDSQLGTGHAVACAAKALRDLSGSLLVLFGDTVLIERADLRNLLAIREQNGADLALLTTVVENPTHYGRIVRDKSGQIRHIVEERDATSEQRLIQEINPGFHCFEVQSLLQMLPQLSSDNDQGEFYLTDLVQLMVTAGKSVIAESTQLQEGALGINNREELARAAEIMRKSINSRWMAEGVSLLDPTSTFLDSTVEIGQDTILYPGVYIEGQSHIGRRCRIHGYCHLVDVQLENDVIVDHACVIRNSQIGARSSIGPFAHLRGDCRVGADVRVGNFVEIKNSEIGAGTKAAHLTYLGDASLGKRVNVGAGTITCNYDGVHKHRTVIEDGVFVGSNSQLIAPVRIGAGAYVAAGSTIVEDVPPGSLAIARSRQVIKEGWTDKD